jgi:acetolactate synthase-1/2/3 large subunit
MTIAEMIVEAAKRNGLAHYFGLPGSGAPMDIMEAGRKAGIEFVSVAHESAAAVAAGYYGHMKGCAGLALAIKGPGAGNLAGGAVVSFFERKPVVCLCESVESSRPLAQSCDHQGLYRSVAKSYFRLRKETAAGEVAKAFALAVDGRPGPVLVDIAGGLSGEPSSDPGATEGAAAAEPDGGPLAAARDFLSSLERPVVIAGADVQREGLAAELRELADSAKAAVLVTMGARGILPEDHPQFAGVYTGLPSPNVLGNQILARADGVLLIGVDAIMTEAPWNKDLPACELVSRSDYETLTENPRVRVNGSLGAAVKDLITVRNTKGYAPELIAEIRQQAGRRFARPSGARLAVQDIIETTRSLLPRSGVLFSETGIFVLMLEHLWPVYEPDTFFGTTAGRTMGLMIPAILGGKLARPEVSMVGIGADGSSLMRLGELEVFARTGVAVPLVVVNDATLGTIKSRQKSRGLPAYGLDLHTVDFAAVARACGLNGVVVQTPEEFRTELAQALEADRTTVIDARVDAQPYQDSFGPTTGA